MPAPVLVVHVLDDLFATAALDVDVDVGRPVAFGRQEPFEQQAERDRVGVGDAERVANRGVRGRAATLAEDVGASTELHEVPHHEEVAGEAELFDERELVIDLGVRATCPFSVSRTVSVMCSLLGDLAQVAHLVEPRWTRERGQVRCDEREIERALASEHRRVLDHPRVASETGQLLVARTQMRTRRCGQPAVDVTEAAPRPHRSDRRGEPAPHRAVVVDVVGRDEVEVGADREFDQRVVARRIERVPVVPELDHHVVAPETLDEIIERATSGAWAVALERRRHRCLATAGEDDPVIGPGPTGRPDRGELIEGGPRSALLPRELRFAQSPGQSRVAHRVAGEDHRMLPMGVGLTRFVMTGHPEGDLGPEHRGEPLHPSCLSKADHPVEPVVIGERKPFKPKPHRFFDQLFGVRRPIEEAEVRVTVQLGIGHAGGTGNGQVRRHIGCALARPGRAVPPVTDQGAIIAHRPGAPLRPAGLGAIGQRTFDRSPRNIRIVEAHRATITNVCS